MENLKIIVLLNQSAGNFILKYFLGTTNSDCVDDAMNLPDCSKDVK
jgi:hypothetical protein